MRGSILVVGASHPTASLVVWELTRTGYGCVEVQLGTEALRRVGGGKIDMALVDAVLPDMTGLDLCRTIRHQSDVPVLLMMDSPADDRSPAFEAGPRQSPADPNNPRRRLQTGGRVQRRRAGRPLQREAGHRGDVVGQTGPQHAQQLSSREGDQSQPSGKTIPFPNAWIQSARAANEPTCTSLSRKG